MEVNGRRSQEDIDKLMAAKAACEAADVPVPDAIAEQLGEGYEDKSPNELRIVDLPREAVTFYQGDGRTGVVILLDKIPSSIRELLILRKPAESISSARETSSALDLATAGAAMDAVNASNEPAAPPDPDDTPPRGTTLQ